MATGSVPISAGTGTPIRIVNNAGVDAGADQQVVSLADSAGNLLGTASAPVPTSTVNSTISGTITAVDGGSAPTTPFTAPYTVAPAANSFVGGAVPDGCSSFTVTLTGTIGTTFYFEASFDGAVTYIPIEARQLSTLSQNVWISAGSPGGIYRGNIAGATHFRVRSYSGSGGTNNATVVIKFSPAVGAMFTNSPIELPVLIKGSQRPPGYINTLGISTQDLKDSGRTAVVISATAVTSATTAALFSLNIYKAGVVSTGVTQYTVTSGSTFRLQSIQFGCRFITPSTTVTFASSRFDLRSLPSGTLAVTSNLVYGDTKMAVSNAPTPNSDLAIPDGLEFPSGTVFGVSHVDSAATLALDVLLVGYEY